MFRLKYAMLAILLVVAGCIGTVRRHFTMLRDTIYIPTSQPTAQAYLAPFSNPDEYLRVLMYHFSYRYDKETYGVADYWQSPEEFARLGYGDCEDFAIFTGYAFLYKGWSIASYLGIVYNHQRNFAHAYTIVEVEEGFYAIDYDVVFPTCPTLGEAKESITQRWQVPDVKYIVYEIKIEDIPTGIGAPPGLDFPID